MANTPHPQRPGQPGRLLESIYQEVPGCNGIGGKDNSTSTIRAEGGEGGTINKYQPARPRPVDIPPPPPPRPPPPPPPPPPSAWFETAAHIIEFSPGATSASPDPRADADPADGPLRDGVNLPTDINAG